MVPTRPTVIYVTLLIFAFALLALRKRGISSRNPAAAEGDKRE